jgi:hypothetical protein
MLLGGVAMALVSRKTGGVSNRERNLYILAASKYSGYLQTQKKS